MSKLAFELVVGTAAVLGIVLTVAYFRVAQKLYSRDKEHPAVRPTRRGERTRTSEVKADAARLQNKESQEPPRL